MAKGRYAVYLIGDVTNKKTGKPLSQISLSVNKSGHSTFFQQSKKGEQNKLISFDHQSLVLPEFIYDNKTKCPSISPLCQDGGSNENVDYCGEYIHYSPYGVWNVTIDAADIDLSKVTGVRFEFMVYYSIDKENSRDFSRWVNMPSSVKQGVGMSTAQVMKCGILQSKLKNKRSTQKDDKDTVLVHVTKSTRTRTTGSENLRHNSKE